MKNNDGTEHSLIFGNRTVDDILLKDELISLGENYKEKFKLFLTVDVKPEANVNWKYGVGFVTQDMLKKNMPAPSDETIILYCGPPPFKEMMKKHLAELGYTENMIFKF